MKQLVIDAARELVILLGEQAHARLARDEAARTVELYLADDDDAEAIGDPLASMANRRVGMLEVAGSPDAADVIVAVIGLLSYGMKQVDRWRAARRLRRNPPAQGHAELLSPTPADDPSSAAGEPVSGPGNGAGAL